MSQAQTAKTDPRVDALASEARRLAQSGQTALALQSMRRATLLDPKQGVELARMLMFLADDAAAAAEAAHALREAECAGSTAAGYWLALLALGDHVEPRRLDSIQQRLALAAAEGLAPAARALALLAARESPHAAVEHWAPLHARGDVLASLLLREALCDRAAQDRDHAAHLRVLDRHLETLGLPRLPRITSPQANTGTQSVPTPWDCPAPMRLHHAPDVEVIDGLFGLEDCRYLIAAGLPHLRRSQVFDPSGERKGTAPIRSSEDASFDISQEDFALRLLQLRMARAAHRELVQGEPLILLHYRPGQEYRPHRDYLAPSALATMRPEAGQRVRTVCVYLNAVEAGGETEFPELGLRIQPHGGRALVFDNLRPDGSPEPSSLHAGLPVTRGEKWLATLWLRQRALRRY